MIKSKPKSCDGPCGKLKVIWKNFEGKRYCKTCWSCQSRKSKPKPTVKQKRLPSKSFKQTVLHDLYMIIRNQFLKHHPFCRASLPGCSLIATDVHHKSGRGQYLLDDSKFLSTCRKCHGWIEAHPDQAIILGFSESRLELKT